MPADNVFVIAELPVPLSWCPVQRVDPDVVPDLNAPMIAPNDPGIGPRALALALSETPAASTLRVDPPTVAIPTNGPSKTKIPCK